MKTLLLFLLAAMGFGVCRAQDDKATEAFEAARARITTPPYGLAKVNKLIGQIKFSDDDDDNYTTALSAALYNKLTVREKFTYNMIHPESHSQNCDVIEPLPEENKKILGQLSDPFDGAYWSERQDSFFKDNKDSVIALMTESISRAGYIGLNYKNIIVNIDANRMIPFLIETYNRKKNDQDILTVLMLLMRDGKYPAFMTSSSYKKLYGDKETSRRTSIVYNPENVALIIQRATDFYNGLAH